MCARLRRADVHAPTRMPPPLPLPSPGRPGTHADMHVDAWCSHFYMIMIEGRKRCAWSSTAWPGHEARARVRVGLTLAVAFPQVDLFPARAAPLSRKDAPLRHVSGQPHRISPRWAFCRETCDVNGGKGTQLDE